MSAIGFSAPRVRNFHISSSADWRQDQLVFARQQSLAMREMAWEGRIKPLRSWSSLITTWACVGLATLALVSLLT